MAESLLCGFSHLNGTPVFMLPSVEKELKRVFGATFARKDGITFFPAFYPYALDVIHDLDVVYPDLPFTEAAKNQVDMVNRCDATPITLPDMEFVTKPYEHQKEALAFALRNMRCALFLDMGLGKTKIIVDLIRFLGQKALILSPVVGLGTWAYEVEKHTNATMSTVCVHGTPKAKRTQIETSEGVNVMVVGYDTAKSETWQKLILETFDYGIIVADESHNLRGPSTQRTKAAVALASKAGRRILLTGTPSLGTPLHLWGQLTFLGKYVPALNEWVFRKHHCMFAKKNKKMIVGFKNLDLLHRKVQRIALRKTKEECLDLPGQSIVDVPFTLEKAQLKFYNDLVSGAIVDLENGQLYEPDHAAVTLQKLLQVLSGFMIMPPPPVCDGCQNLAVCVEARIKPFTNACAFHPKAPKREIQYFENPKLDVLGDILSGIDGKVIVWCYFSESLNLVEEHLKKEGLGYIRVDGSNSKKAQEFAKEFNTNPDVKVWLAQISTGVALTLTAATYTIYYDLSYDLGDYLQSKDRNYRIGQTKPVFVYKLLAEKSVAAFVSKALEFKLDLAQVLTDRINCVLCEHGVACVAKGTKPFDNDCIYDSAMNRTIIKPVEL